MSKPTTVAVPIHSRLLHDDLRHLVGEELRSLLRRRVGQRALQVEVALVLIGDEPGRHAREERVTGEEDQRHHADDDERAPHQHAHAAAVMVGDEGERAVEAAEEGGDRTAAAAGLLRLQQQRAQGRRQSQRDEGREHHRHRHRQRELLVQLTGDAGDERHRHEHRDEHERDGHHWPGHFVHRLPGCLNRRELVVLDDVFDRLDDHDRIVDDDADGEDHAEERQRIHREAERRVGHERRQQRHRHGQHRDQRRAPALEEQRDDDEDEEQRFEERVNHFLDRGVHELRCVDDGEVAHIVRERRPNGLQLLANQAGALHGVRARREIHGHDRCRPAVVLRGIVVGFRTEGDIGDVTDADEPAGGQRLDDDVAEFLLGDQAALDPHRVLESLAARHRRGADLASRHLHVLLSNRRRDVVHGEVETGHVVGPEPDAHAEVGAEDGHVADAAHALQPVDQRNRREVVEEGLVARAVRRVRRDEHQGVRRLLTDRDPGVDHVDRQRRLRLRHPGLDLVGGEIRIALEAERHRDVRRPVVGAGPADVEHVGDAVDRNVELRRDRGLDDVGDGAQIGALHPYGWQRDLGILGDRQTAQRDRPAEDQEQRDDGGEDRTIDEKARHGSLLAPTGRRRASATFRRSPRPR